MEVGGGGGGGGGGEAEEARGRGSSNGGGGIRVSLFDNSIENHFNAMDTIASLCGEPEDSIDPLHQPEFQRLSSSVTFLREWRHFNYESRVVKFARETSSPSSPQEINLPQFSSAAVPKEETASPLEPSKDFVMYVGGSAWALDWCPRVCDTTDCRFKCEFVAISAHPPGSYYHKVGVSLTGRGMVQIWCVLNMVNEEEEPPPMKKAKLGRSGKELKEQSANNEATGNNSSQLKRPRGRPRKNSINESPDSNRNEQHFQALSVQYSEGSLELLSVDGNTQREEESTELKRPKGRPKKKQIEQSPSGEATKDNSSHLKRPRGRPRKNPTNKYVQAVSVKFSEQSPSNKGIKESPAEVICPTGQPTKKLTNESLDLNCNQINPVPVVQPSEDSLKLLATEETAGGGETLIELKRAIRRTKKWQKQKSPSIEATEENLSQVKRPRAQCKRKQINESLDSLDCSNPVFQPLAVQLPEKTVLENEGRRQKGSLEIVATSSKPLETGVQDRTLESALMEQSNSLDNVLSPLLLTENEGSPSLRHRLDKNAEQNSVVHNSAPDNVPRDLNDDPCSIPKDVALPRVVLCLAHNGKVAWDVKWRPSSISDPKCWHRMGYLAVLLGNGSLEVWDVPLPQAIKFIYSSSLREGTDPRFVKLKPIFKCSSLKCGERQSLPLTVEWSTSGPHDYLLAGCHDGMVALWKFSTSCTSGDTRPLLCFSADTVPIRAVAWAPVESSEEGANVIATAGYEVLKFWDTRDPFRPIWEFPVPGSKFVYGLDWLPDPRCIMLSLHEGTTILVSLPEAANNASVTGTISSVGPKQQGLRVVNISSSAVWSVQVSRITGMVAYCCADGTVSRFQLTTKAVEKELGRHRAPHFICGSLSVDDSAITINTPLPEVPVPLTMKRPPKRAEDKGALPLMPEPKQRKRRNAKEKSPASHDQPLALCYGNDSGMESEPGETSAALESRNKSKSKSSKTKTTKEDRALMCIDGDQFAQEKETEEGEDGNKSYAFPPKIVALHKVRWNMNKGSERWLCYGGAAGIVRCQEIIMSDLDKAYASKR